MADFNPRPSPDLPLKPVISRIDTDGIALICSYTWTRSISLNYPLIFHEQTRPHAGRFKFVEPECLKIISGVGFI